MLTLLLVIGLALSQFLHVVIQVAAIAAAGVPIERINLYLGPRLWSWAWGKTAIVLRPIPIGVYVAMDGEVLMSRPRALRVLLFLAAPLTLLVAGCLLARVDPLRIGWAVYEGLLHPVQVGAPLLRAYRDHFQQAVAYPFGCLLIAQSLLELVPIPPTNGGKALATLAHLPSRVISLLDLAGLVPMLLVAVSALVAYCSA